ncbi:ankyrin repeat domain-containing protein [Actinoplanes sp. ATCC 53533]|uniref:ankyrin repeat domain-containing protein n=1 Tax=Actinoplanes sp. ATCC 53533 TaxID=1288362 RepID=UPI000F79F4D9|nr:ankyrin repeat domain-containing protein [Actinoplanes sp. ATCC 53533]
MITSARDGDLLVLGRVLDEDPAAVNARGWMGETPLHAAAAAGSAGAVRMLLEAGADARVRRDNGDTPLHRAATGEIAELLFRAGRDVTADQHNEFRQTPLHCAQDREVTAVLLRCGASLSARDHRGGTPLHHAGAAKARVLLDAGADIEARDDQGQTPLHRAVWDGDTELVALLLAESADPVVRDHGGSSPIHLARSRGPQEIRTLLAAAGGSLAEPTSPTIIAGSAQSALHMGRDGRVAYSVAGHATLVRWRLDRPSRPEVIVPTEHAAIHDLAVHPRRRLIAVAPVDALAELRDDDLTDPEPLRGLEDVTALAFSPDGRWLAAAGHPERVVLFDPDTRQITADAEAGERTNCVNFSPDGSLLATTCSFQGGAHVRIDRVTAHGGLELVTEIERPARDTIPAAVFTPDSRYLVIWETSAIDNERRAPGWRGDVLLTDTDGNVIWQRAIDAETTGMRAPLAAVGAPMGWFTKPCITPDGEMIALGFDGTVVLLSTNDGNPLAVLPVDGTANAAAADPVTGALVVATDQGLREIEVKTNLSRRP